MTSVRATWGIRATRAATRSRLYRLLLVVALVLAPALTPYLLTPTFAFQNKVIPTYAGHHTGAPAGHPTELPDEDPHVHPHCRRCVLFASLLPIKVVLIFSAPLGGEPPQLEVSLPPSRWFNPNVGARAPPEADIP